MEGTGGFLSYSGMRRWRHRSGGSAENAFFQFVFEQPRRPCSVECVQLENLRPYEKTKWKNSLFQLRSSRFKFSIVFVNKSDDDVFFREDKRSDAAKCGKTRLRI